MCDPTVATGYGPCVGVRTSCFILGYANLAQCTILIVAFSWNLRVAAVAEVNGSQEGMMSPMVQALHAVALSHFIAMLTLNLMLLLGLHKNKRRLVRVYIIMTGFLMAMEFISFLVGIFISPRYDAELILSRVGVLIMQSYSFVLVRNYYPFMARRTNKTVTYTATAA